MQRSVRRSVQTEDERGNRTRGVGIEKQGQMRETIRKLC